MFGNNNPSPFGNPTNPPKTSNLFGQTSPQTTSTTTDSQQVSTATITQPTAQFLFSQTAKPIFGGGKSDDRLQVEVESNKESGESSSSFLKTVRESDNPFGKISNTFTNTPPAHGLFPKPFTSDSAKEPQTSQTQGFQQPIPSATSLFEPSTSASFFLNASKSVKPVFSAKTLSKTSLNLDKAQADKNIESKSLFPTSTNPFSFKPASKSNSKSLFGIATASPYKSSISSPFSFVKKPESSSATEKSTSSTDITKIEKNESNISEKDSNDDAQQSGSKRAESSLGGRLRIKQRIGKVPDEISESPIKQRVMNTSDLRKYKSILIKGTPKQFNNKMFIKKHFSQFGQVTQMKCNLKREHTIIYFKDHESAANAKKHGGLLDPNMDPFPIFYTTDTHLRRKSSTSEPESGELRLNPVSRSSNIDDELKAMGALPLEPPKIIKRRPKSSIASVIGKSDHTEIKTVRQQPVKKTPSQPSMTSTATSSSQPKNKQDPEPLVALLNTVTNNAGERYRVLDARDKLMRMKITKQSDLATAKAVKGTCPDMCPEKERYSRADKFCLSSFEMSHVGQQNVMDPNKVLKEYSRSSADQEEPLSHELRPVKVLQTTMDYLLCNLMDYPETSGEWYDFIWNRTRAIRKDITQQHLCDVISVGLVEKCARFHIHCSETLSEEDVAVFDPKINNENLTKCLQTLKHFYTDLEEKAIACPNEAEFRAYEILLNLNESDIASQVQTLRHEIRTSEHVKFANQVFQAASSNNYVRFFSLLKKATYLQACLMHRYFAQIRTKALKVILKAYRQPNQFTIEELIRILAFEEFEDAVNFCSWLQIVVEDNCVSLNKPLGIPDGPAPILRSRKYIESKRICSVGEIVNGGPSPVNPLEWYIPHDSFDINGVLKQDAYNALDQANRMEMIESPVVKPNIPVYGNFPPLAFTQSPMFKPAPQLASPQSPPILRTPTPPPPLLSQEDIEELIDDNLASVIIETSNSLIRDVASETIRDFQIIDAGNKLLSETTADILRNAVKETIREMKEVVAEKKYLEKVERVAVSLEESLTQEVVQKEATVVATLIHSQAREKFIQEIAEDVMEEIAFEQVEESLAGVAKLVYKDEIDFKLKVERFFEKKALQRSKKYFLRWAKICAQRKTLEFVRRTFPASSPLIVDDISHLCVRKNPKSILDLSIEEKQATKNIDSSLCFKLLSNCLVQQPIDLLQSIAPSLVSKYKSPPGFISYKTAFILPGGEEAKQKEFCKWLTKKLSFKETIGTSFDKNPKIEDISYSQSFGHSRIGCSMLIVGRSGQSVPSQKLTGLSSLTVFFDVLEDDPKSCFSFVESFLKSKPQYPPLPISVLLINYEKKYHKLKFEICLILDCLCESYVSKYRLFNLDFNDDPIQFNEDLEDALYWTVKNFVPQPVLKSAYLRDYLEEGVKKFTLDSVFQDLLDKQRRFNTHHIQALDAIVDLFNTTVEHLANVAGNPDLSNHSWPAPEFINKISCYSKRWNSPNNLNEMKCNIESLTLHPSCVKGLDFMVQKSVSTFVLNIFGPTDHAVLTEVNDLVEKYVKEFVPWADVFVVVVRHLLNGLDYYDKDGNELTVHYDSEDFNSFLPPYFWLEATRDSSCEIRYLQNDTKSIESQVPIAARLNVNEEVKLESAKSDDGHSEIDRLVSTLSSDLSREREASRKFQQKLEELVNDDNFSMGYSEWLHQPSKRNIMCDGDYFVKKMKIESSGYLNDDVQELSNLLQSEKRQSLSFTRKLEELLNE